MAGKGMNWVRVWETVVGVGVNSDLVGGFEKGLGEFGESRGKFG